MERERIIYLLNAYTSGKATDAEEDELMAWVLEAEDDESLQNFVSGVWSQQISGGDYDYVNWEEIYSRFVSRAEEVKPESPRIMRRFRWVAAASILLMTSVAYFYFSPDKRERAVTVQSVKEDVAPPSGDKAVLILADGTKIEMDSTSNGMIAMQGDVRIIRDAEGTIIYTGKGGEAVRYNTFNVPKGSKPLSLLLSDGSKVWLNVGSSLTFPTAFVGEEREVTIEGEAYFEVAHNAAMPFKVKNEDITVQVLGTHFNVNGYKDAGVGKITLLEGSVVVNRRDEAKTLKPGQQALVDGAGENIQVRTDVDLNEVMAWRKGEFVFNQYMDIEDIMLQIARWYDVDVAYKGKVNQRFWGSISRDVNLSQVLKILEATGRVKFEIEGNKINVLPVVP